MTLDANDIARNHGVDELRDRLDGNREDKSGPTRLIQASEEFVSDFVPPDYLIDGLLQRRFVYSMTAPTGAGKTCVAMRIATHVALGLSLDEREVEQARALFFAGENPDDVRMRWIKLCEDLGQAPADVDVFFLPGTHPISNDDIRSRIDAETDKHGPFGLVIVDTSAAYFRGDDENSNTQLGEHARMLRSLTELSGGPTVLVTCHPTKNPNMSNLLPRGGGAFIAEMDGNLVCIREEDANVIDLHWHGKFRGPDFGPIPFKLQSGTTERLKDSKGRPISTVTAVPLSAKERDELEGAARERQDDLLAVMLDQRGLSLAGMAQQLGWSYRNGKPNKSAVNRAMQALRAEKLVEKKRERWALTKEGKKVAEQVPKPVQGCMDLAVKDDDSPI